ncbi:MAG TPA: tripartite tricarboxylate transporter substrate binding protein [Burkholderiales bacterium]
MKRWLAVAAAALAFSAAAQEYPTKTVRIIVPLTPGSGADIAGRIIAQRMGEHWKQPVIVENRPGAGGQIGTSAVVKAEADGHTLLVQSSSHSANPAIYKQLPYDAQKDLADVAILGKTPYVMVTSANGPYKSLKELIEAARAQPGTIPFASAGIGTSTHLAAEFLLALAGIKMVHVPFKGSPDAMQDVLGGRSSFYMAPINAGVNLVRDGKLRALGVSTKGRADVLASVPSIAEQGLYDYDMTLWFGMWAPAATPLPVVQKLNAAVNAIVLEPQVKAQFEKLGIQPSPMKTEDFAKFVRSEMDVYKKIVQHANIPQQ